MSMYFLCRLHVFAFAVWCVCVVHLCMIASKVEADVDRCGQDDSRQLGCQYMIDISLSVVKTQTLNACNRYMFANIPIYDLVYK